MRSILTSVLVLAFVAGFGAEAGAARLKAKPKSHAGHLAKHDRSGSGPSPYQERLLQTAPFGSKLWWELMNPPVAGR